MPLRNLAGFVIDVGEPQRIPDVVGQPVAVAIREHRWPRVPIEVSAQEVDATAAFGTIVWQTPMPGGVRERR